MNGLYISLPLLDTLGHDKLVYLLLHGPGCSSPGVVIAASVSQPRLMM